MLLAQITDLHMRADETPLSGAIVTRPYTIAAVDALNALRPDAVVITGDLTDIGTDAEYALLRAELERLTMPIYLIPGNHDRRAELRAAFADHAYLPSEGPLQWVVDDHPVRLIGLDSVIPGASHGEVTTDSLAWLDATLAADPRPTIVAIHHPPFPTGIASMDQIGCRNGEALGQVIARHPHVARVIAGHHHRPVQILWRGTLGIIAPSIAHQVALDFELAEIASWILEPPAMLLHRWTESSGIVTHMAYIGAFDGPHKFNLDPAYPGA
ncbi:MAG: phosphodiesterase [Pikeienuella sp.]